MVMKDVPFFMVRNDSDAATSTGNDRFTGFTVDVIKALSAMLNFRYELYVVDDGRSAGHGAGSGSTASENVVRELLQGVSASLCLNENAPTLASCSFDRHGPWYFFFDIFLASSISNCTLSKMICLFNCLYLFTFAYFIVPPPPYGGGIKRCICQTFCLCLSVAYIGLNSRTEKPRKTKIGTEVAHVTRVSDTIFKVKGQGSTCCWCLK